VIGGLVVATEEASAARRSSEKQGAIGRRSGEVDDLTLRAAVNGDHAAFETIVGVYEPRLRVLACQILRDRLLVDDALQDVFFQVYRNLHKFRGDAALGTWLHRVTYTSCLNLLRKQRGATVPLDLLEGDAALEQLDEELSIKLRLEYALASLDPEHRIAVLLVDRDGYDYGWVAGVLGIPVGTVASRLHTARRRLRAALGELEDAAGEDVVTEEEE
jgi:RNA polymerase sigma-70 factor, ECF subfamily